MRVIVTCGPSYEPIDQVRRITNFSTGELGILLANALSKDGHEVLCLKGAGATCPLPLDGARVVSFTTNDDLRMKLAAARDGGVDAVFHAAALCDFKVARAVQGDGEAGFAAKIPSRGGKLTLLLEPLPKLISELRALFPTARIVGWKYELEGEREQAVAASRRQMLEAKTDACVVNGAAFGSGFSLLPREGELAEFDNKTTLCQGLVEWLGARLLSR